MRFFKRLKRTIAGDNRAAEIRDELEFHLAMDVEAGRDRIEARRRLGNPERIEDETRAVRIIPWLSSLLRDFRDALRLVANAPLLSLAVVGSLALGIGANTAIFSLIDAAILKKLPIEDPDALVMLEWVSDGFPFGVESLEGTSRDLGEDRLASPSVAESFYRQIAAADTGFDALIGATPPENITIAVPDRPAETAMLQYVSGNFFRDVGVIPPFGRGFLDEEDAPGGPPAVVVSHRFWTSRLGQSADVPGSEIRVNGVPVRVVGVAPRGFFGFQPGVWTDLYVPLATRDAIEPTPPDQPRNDTYWWVSLFGRLSESVPADVATQRIGAALTGFAASLAPDADAEALPSMMLSPAPRGFAGSLQDNEIEALWILQLLVGVLLLIVCANVANLLLSRSVSVQRDSALRLALGASRTRLFQKSLIESATFAALGAIIGLGLGLLLAHAVHDLFQTGRGDGAQFDLGINWHLIAWVTGLAFITTVIFGLAPAVRAMRAGVSDVLKTRARSVFGGGVRLPRYLVSAQIALCLAALTAAGLLARSLDNFATLDLGVDIENLSYASVNPAAAGYTPERIDPYLEAVRNTLEAVPGVDRVGILSRRVLDGAFSISPGALAETPFEPSNIFDVTNAVQVVGVGANAFETLGMTLLRGRGLNVRERDAAVVDERFVEHFFGDAPAIGRRIRLGPEAEYTVVGIVRNVPWSRLRTDDFPLVYRATAAVGAAPFGSRIHFAIHSSLDPADLAAPVRTAIAAIDPAVPIVEFQTQETLIDRLLRVERLLAFVSGSFGFWALALAAMGLAGLLTYAAARRTGEIGVRMALGATRGRVVTMMLRDSFSMVAIGMLIGLPCAYGIGKLLESLLFELPPTDVLSFALALVALALVALAATWLPARRAARIDPMHALREQ